MKMNLAKKIISSHLIDGEMIYGKEIAIKIDQTLTQDATGTMAYLQFEAIGVPRVRTELSVSYVDHNTLQVGFRNPDDHKYLRTVAMKYGVIFSPPGNGICHQLHLENFAVPGKTLLGSDSHTPTAGGVGSLAMGAGGLSVALAMAGEPYTLPMPRIIGVLLKNSLKGWASAKDVILYLLKKLTVKGGVGAIMEYFGEGVKTLTVPERATITNMGAELGATTSIFPSDEQTKRFFKLMGREHDFVPLRADDGCEYDEIIEIDLSKIEPMAACPHMPDNVVTVRELDGLKVDQVAIGSCTNSSYLDLKMAANILKGRHVNKDVDVLLSPGSRQVVKKLIEEGIFENFIDAGVRVLECACGPCIGMGGSPISGGVSVRTFNRNFEGRSGTLDAKVYLTSPITAAHVAISGKFIDPAKWGEPVYFDLPDKMPSIREHYIFPLADTSDIEIYRGPNIVPLSKFEPLQDVIEKKVAIVVGDNITTDHILPGGAEVTSLRSNIPAISEYIYSRVDKDFVPRIKKYGGGIIVGGENYGQGSSREHAALAPRYLGIVCIIAKSFARIHRGNLVNFGILPLIIKNKQDYDLFKVGHEILIPVKDISAGKDIEITIKDISKKIFVTNDLSEEELEIILSGGRLAYVSEKLNNKGE
ncbi:aconitate hydratase [Desulfothermus sp.]